MDPTQELAQFEPDPEGVGSLEPAAVSAAPEDDPQWIVWPDAAGEAALFPGKGVCTPLDSRGQGG